MKKITVGNYREDKYYPKVVRAVEAILANGDVVAPIDAFVHMGLLSKADVELWRFGRVPYLDPVVAKLAWRRRSQAASLNVAL